MSPANGERSRAGAMAGTPQPEGLDGSRPRVRSEAYATAGADRHRSPLQFFVLVFAFSIPFWLIGAVTKLQLLPGLPISALGAFCPMVAALVLVQREGKAAGVTEFLKRSFDFRRIRARGWYVPMLLLMPAVSVSVYALMRWIDMPLPAPQFPVLPALLLLLAFFAAGLGEELGWSGYAIDPLQDRWNALQAGVALGLVGAAWHIVPLLQAHRSAAWIAWWCLYAVSARILIVWLYNHSGRSVFAAALFHATLNLAFMLFPVYGSHFDIRLGGLVMAATAAIATVGWWPRSRTTR